MSPLIRRHPMTLASTKNRRYWIDFAIRALLALTFAIAAGMYFKNALAAFKEGSTGQLDAATVTHGLSVLAIGIYTMMVACLYAVRLRPTNKFAGALPCAAAILGGFLMSGLLFLSPRNDLPLSAQLTASALVIIGNVFTALVLMRLGKSFSILPESRRLVTNGPYRIVRHPVYLAEAVTTVGVLIHFLSVWALVLVVAQLALQLVRIHYEERVLREHFPEYNDYAKTTKRLIPGIY